MTDKKDTESYLKQLGKQGYDVILGGRCHWKVYWKGKLVTVTGSSPNGGRHSLENLKSRIRKWEKERAGKNNARGHPRQPETVR
jgi:hypothetical protein